MKNLHYPKEKSVRSPFKANTEKRFVFPGLASAGPRVSLEIYWYDKLDFSLRFLFIFFLCIIKLETHFTPFPYMPRHVKSNAISKWENIWNDLTARRLLMTKACRMLPELHFECGCKNAKAIWRNHEKIDSWLLSRELLIMVKSSFCFVFSLLESEPHANVR